MGANYDNLNGMAMMMMVVVVVVVVVLMVMAMVGLCNFMLGHKVALMKNSGHNSCS